MIASFEFDEGAYLNANPDVAHAVLDGHIASGWDHYRFYGINEHRLLSRNDRPILAGLDVSSLRGVEIGALCRPLIRRSDGPIWYVDYADTKFLQAHYKDDPSVNTDEIVEVDAVWGEKTLKEALNPQTDFDYTIASHVIEHVPDVVTWLIEIRDILVPNGSLRLVIPDKRYCFDILRRETSVAEILDAYIQRARAPLPRMVLDFFLNVRDVSIDEAWDCSFDPKASRPMYAPQDAINMARSAYLGAYHDVHCSVFTPFSFLNLCLSLSEIGLVRFKCDMFQTTPRGSLEFYVGLQPCDDTGEVKQSWIEALQQAC